MKQIIHFIIFLLMKSVHLKVIKKADDAKIINGRKASMKEYAYAVSISDSQKTHICGGSIITNYHILTACHCTRMNNSGEVFNRLPSTLTIKAGNDNIRRPSGNEQERPVSIILNHPKCLIIESSAIYDVSFLILKDHLEFNNHVQPIKLPFSLSKSKDLVDVSELCRKRLYCHLAGWGQTSEQEASDTLQEIALPLTTTERCNRKLSRVTEGEVQLDDSDTEICADVVEGKDACLGDSGAGLKCGNFLIGVVSWGFECGNQKFPSIFANVMKMRSFVQEALVNYKSSSSSIATNIFIIILYLL